ncbi:MAG: GGDEF domain-containing protein [Methylotetracoccus sp.]
MYTPDLENFIDNLLPLFNSDIPDNKSSESTRPMRHDAGIPSQWACSMLASSPDGIVLWDVSHQQRFENPRAAANIDAERWPAPDTILREFSNESSGSEQALVRDCLRAAIERGGQAPVRLLRARNPSAQAIEASLFPIRDAKGQPVALGLNIRELGRNHAAVRLLLHDATHDDLTALVNRREAKRRINRLLSRRAAGDHHVLGVLDLDGFKNLNDACGHPAGDRALREIASMIVRAVRSRDTVARLGGDEFCILFEHCALEQAIQASCGVIAAIDGFRFEHAQRSFRVGVSIGLAELTGQFENPGALFDAADEACYEAKRRGGNRVEIFTNT